MGLAGSMKRLEGKVEAVEVQNKEEEVEEKEEKEEECDVRRGIDQDELKYGEKKEPEIIKGEENKAEGSKRKEEGDIKEVVGHNLKDAKRNSFRLDYITDMIRR